MINPQLKSQSSFKNDERDVKKNNIKIDKLFGLIYSMFK